MASNFHFYFRRDKDSMWLKLAGDFDGTSAHEVINTIKKYRPKTGRFLIDTDDLKTVHLFGVNVFQKKLSAFGKRSKDLVFIGKHKDRLAPERI